jgi:hypothetical protein
MEPREEVREWIKNWDAVAYENLLPAVEAGDFEAAEDEAAYLVEIDASIMKAINKAEKAMGER